MVKHLVGVEEVLIKNESPAQVQRHFTLIVFSEFILSVTATVQYDFMLYFMDRGYDF